MPLPRSYINSPDTHKAVMAETMALKAGDGSTGSTTPCVPGRRSYGGPDVEWTPAGGFLRPRGLCGFDTPKCCQGLTRPESLDGRRALACAGLSLAVEI